MLLSLAIALNLITPAPQSEIIVKFQPSTVMAKQFMLQDYQRNIVGYKATLPMAEGVLTFEGKTYKIYMPSNFRYDLAKKRDWGAYLADAETAHGIYVDYNGNGDLELFERWMPDLPMRFGNKMMKVKSIGDAQLTFVPADGPVTGVVTGQSFPSFDWKDVDGKRHRLEDYKGKYLLIDVFSITCHNCIEDWPHILEMQKKFGVDRMEVLLVSCDQSYIPALKNLDFPKGNKTIAKEKGMPWPNIMVPGGWEEIIPTFNGFGYGSYLIAPDGKVLMVRGLSGDLEKVLATIK